MFYSLSAAVAGTKDVVEASDLLQDLLSFPEAEMIAKRLKIAQMLMSGSKYAEIREELKVSPGTISRVSEWLERSGDGYRRAVKASAGKDIDKIMDRMPVRNISEIKRRYPMHYWPEILLEHIIANSTKRQQDEIQSVMKNLEKSQQKPELHRRISRLMLKHFKDRNNAS